MATLRLAVHPSLSPTTSRRCDLRLIEQVAQQTQPATGWLRIYELAGELIWLGRYHRVPRSFHSPSVVRRWSGGRVVPAGRNFTVISLFLPHRSALCADHPDALLPHQITNRYVRGLLAGLRHLHLNPVYPGRDLLLIGRRIVGMMSFEIRSSGVLVWEAIVARGRDFSILTPLLERIDPRGELPGQRFGANEVTSLRDELTQETAIEELAAAIVAGFEREFGVTMQVASECVGPVAESADGCDFEWLHERSLSENLPMSSIRLNQLGMMQVHLACDAQDTIVAVQLSGDFIASSAAISELERRLVGRRRFRDDVLQAVDGVFQNPAHFILGVRSLDEVVEMILEAA